MAWDSSSPLNNKICIFHWLCLIGLPKCTYYIFMPALCYFSLFLLLFSVKLFNVVTNLISTFLHPPLVSLIHKGAGHKNYIKLIVDIIIRAKTTECLEENIGVNLCYFVLGDCLSDMSPKHKWQKQHRLHFIKMKNFRGTINTLKSQKGDGKYSRGLRQEYCQALTKYIKNSSRYGTIPTKPPLGDSRRPQTSSRTG